MGNKTKDTIKNLKYPRNTTELRSFIGLCNVYRRLVPNFSRKAPLEQITEKRAPKTFDLNEDERAAVGELEQNLIEPQMFSLSITDQQFTLETDSCEKYIGCVLLQPQKEEKGWRSVGNW